MSKSCQWTRLLGKFSWQMFIARSSWHLHIFINITHFTKIPMWKLFKITPMEKSKAEKSPWVKKMKITEPKEERKSSILSSKVKNLAASFKALGLAKRLRQAQHLLKIWSVRKPFRYAFCLCLYLWHLCPLLRGRTELNCTERDKKRLAMRCFSREIMIYCHRHQRSCFSIGFIGRDNLQAWCELFTNLNKLKSRIWFLEEYIHFERIYRYLDLTDCREISPEHSRDNDKPKCVGKFWYLTQFSCGVHLRNMSHICLATPTLDVNILITNQHIKKAQYAFVDWCLGNNNHFACTVESDIR